MYTHTCEYTCVYMYTGIIHVQAKECRARIGLFVRDAGIWPDQRDTSTFGNSHPGVIESLCVDGVAV